nr:MAG TPA: hypothetical protein [Caudoviricetes sp.]
MSCICYLRNSYIGYQYLPSQLFRDISFYVAYFT